MYKVEPTYDLLHCYELFLVQTRSSVQGLGSPYNYLKF